MKTIFCGKQVSGSFFGTAVSLVSVGIVLFCLMCSGCNCSNQAPPLPGESGGPDGGISVTVEIILPDAGGKETVPEPSLPERPVQRSKKVFVTAANIQSLQFSPDGSQLAVGASGVLFDDVFVYEVNAPADQKVYLSQGFGRFMVNGLKWLNPDVVVFGNRSEYDRPKHLDPGVYFWRVRLDSSNKQRFPVGKEDENSFSTSLAAAANGRSVIVGKSNGQFVRIFDDSGTWRAFGGDYYRHKNADVKLPVGDVKFLPGESGRYVIGVGSLVALVNAASGKPIHEYTSLSTSRDDQVISISVSWQKDLVAAAFMGGRIEVYDLDTKQLVAKLEGLGSLKQVAFLRDGRLAACRLDDGKLMIFELTRDRKVVRLLLPGHSDEDGINTVAVSPDGKLLATGSDDGTIRIWDVPER